MPFTPEKYTRNSSSASKVVVDVERPRQATFESFRSHDVEMSLLRVIALLIHEK
jgi:hypothetical protein